MKQQERIRLLLSMQEHPENYTDEQITRMLADDPELAELMEQLAMTKRAFVKQEADKEDIPMDELWNQFAIEHSEEIDALDTRKEEFIHHPVPGSPLRKVLFGAKLQSRAAAVFIGTILAAGIAFAAIHIVKVTSTPKAQVSQTEHPVSPIPAKEVEKDTVRMDSTIKATPTVVLEPVVFDNIRLDEILPQIADYYHVEISFKKEEARELRFYFVWKREDGLEHTIEKLNRFESLSLRLDGNIIIVE